MSNVGRSPWAAVDALGGLRLSGLARPDLGVRRGRGRPPHIHRYGNFRNRTLESPVAEKSPSETSTRLSTRHASGPIPGWCVWGAMGIWDDFGFGIRALRKGPGLTFVAAVSLELGIGLNTAIFTMMN